MKNTHLFPLSRNRYFRGKQLVSRDMEAEQRYFNNKRRLLNSQLYGCGVVCGLVVTAVGAGTEGGDMAVAVEPGLAIDGLGREVVVQELVYLPLAKLDGFSDHARSDRPLYLCIEYAERECEPVHSVADSAVADDQHNRVEEGHRFFLRHEEPTAESTWKAGGTCERITQEYYAENLQKRLDRGQSDVLVLARIHLLRWDTAYSIKQVEPMPFGQYVATAKLLEALQKAAWQQQEMDSAAHRAAVPAQTSGSGLQGAPSIRHGTVTIEVPRGTKAGTVLLSEQIPHGLGIGPVGMSIGLLVDNRILYGAQDIFAEEAPCTYALRICKDQGTFEVGVRINGPVAGNRVTLAWTAVQDATQVYDHVQAPELLITPAFTRLPIRGTAKFVATLGGVASQSVRWSVRDEEGGTISADGSYRAPQTAGVYEVVAQSVERPDVQTSAFVVVTES